jgi:hypothetical protein
MTILPTIFDHERAPNVGLGMGYSDWTIYFQDVPELGTGIFE